MRVLCSVAVVLSLVFPLAAYGAASKPAQFSFQPGQHLTYHLRQEAKGSAASGPYSAMLEGDVTFTVARLRADGTAELSVTAHGKGTMGSGWSAVPFDTEAPAPVTLVVAPTGAITEILDAAGKPTSLLAQDGEDLINAARILRAYACGTYTLFGLQLPEKAVPLKGAWTGTHQEEVGHFVGKDADLDLGKMTVTRSTRKVRFAAKGTSILQGRPCWVIASPSAVRLGGTEGAKHLPGTYWFDTATGELVQVEVKAAASNQTSISYTATLVTQKPVK